jgi:hypothetical protein
MRFRSFPPVGNGVTLSLPAAAWRAFVAQLKTSSTIG